MTVNREIVESPVAQGVEEIIAYTLDTAEWGGTPTSPSVVVYDVTDGGYDDVTSTVMPTNSPSVSDDVITLSALKLLTIESKYRIEVKFVTSGNTLEAYAIIDAER